MLTAEQARSLTVNKGVLKIAENLIESTAKQGKRRCIFCLPYEKDYGSLGDVLEQRGFEISYDNSNMIIRW